MRMVCASCRELEVLTEPPRGPVMIRSGSEFSEFYASNTYSIWVMVEVECFCPRTMRIEECRKKRGTEEYRGKAAPTREAKLHDLIDTNKYA